MNKFEFWQKIWCVCVTVTVAFSLMHSESPALGRAIQGDAPGIASATDAETPERGVSRKAEYRAAARAAAEAAEARAEERARLKAAERLPAAADSSIPVTAPEPEQIIRTMTVTATGYTAGYESTGKRPDHPEYGITYSGVKVRRDKNAVSTIAADPKVLPLGSILYIPGYGYAVVADTGSAIKGRKIDLYFATTKQVYNEWGKKTVDVQLIRRGSGKCTEAMLRDLAQTIRAYDFVPQSKLEELI